MKTLIAIVIVLVLVVAIALGVIYWLGAPAGSLLVEDFSKPLNGTRSATIDIDMGEGNLTVDSLTGGEPLLVGGTLEYFEESGPPAWTLTSINDEAALALRTGQNQRPRIRLPWAACTAENDWMLHLNPQVSYGVSAHTGRGNVTIDLSGIPVTGIASETGAGRVDIRLPENVTNLNAAIETGAGDVAVEVGKAAAGHNVLSAESGAGSVEIVVPRGVQVRVYATSIAGKVTVDSDLIRIDDNTYQSRGYDLAEDRIEITVHSGIGNVSVTTQ